MDNISALTAPTGCRALRTRTAMPRPEPGPRTDDSVLASALLGVTNARSLTGMPVVPVHENCVQQTAADTIVGGLYVKIVKRGELSTLNVDLERLCRALAGSASLGELETEQRVSNVYLGKALNTLCRLVAEGDAACDRSVLVRAVNWCVEVIRGRSEFTLENLSVIMFHLGGLINLAPVSKASSDLVCQCLVPRFDTMLKDAPQQAADCTTLALGLVSALRASELEMRVHTGGTVPPFAPDALFTTLHALRDARPDLLTRWETRSLALVAKYGMQYLSRVAALGKRCSPTDTAMSLQLNAAQLLKPVIEEARRPERGVWDQRNSVYRSLSQGKEIRDYLAYATHYYCRWLAGQPEHIRARFELAEPARGPLPDNPCDERGFAEVAWLGVEAPTPEKIVIDVLTASDIAIADAVVRVTTPSLDLLRFNETANALAARGEDADRFDREDAIAATNALVASIESGRAELSQAQRVQMLLNMDAICQHLAAATAQAPQYAWQLSSMRDFLSAQLTQVVGSNGKPLMAAEVPAGSGLSSWQRSLLVILNCCEPER